VVAGDRAAVATARLNLSFSRVAAPVSGRVGLRAVDVGAYVTPADPAGVVTITQITPMDVAFAAPQGDLPRIQARLARGSPPVTALDPARTTTLAQGVFLTLDNTVDPTTGTVKAKARFANSRGELYPNQFVNVRVLLDTDANAVTIPAAAVRTGPRGAFVYVVGADRKARVRLVRRGAADGDAVAIARGLALGETVVISGGDQLSDGAPVRLPAAGPVAAVKGRPGRAVK
jgi:multidrug efflux system membrane fusion protein